MVKSNLLKKSFNSTSQTGPKKMAQNIDIKRKTKRRVSNKKSKKPKESSSSITKSSRRKIKRNSRIGSAKSKTSVNIHKTFVGKKNESPKFRATRTYQNK